MKLAKPILNRLVKQVEQLRLSQNMTQAALAREAGVSTRTITRMEAGETVSLDTFVRVLMALGVADRLAGLLPEPDVRPIERVRFKGKERQRASGKRSSSRTSDEPWSWGDDDGE